MQNGYDDQKGENLKILAIGFILIFIIGAITFFKSGLLKYPTKTDQKTELDLKKRETIDSTKISKLTSIELAKEIRDQKELTLLDLRSDVDYKKEHIPNSQNIPLDQLPSAFSILDKSKTYVLFDDTCEIITVNSVANIFAANKYKNIYYLDGGFNAWKNQFNSTISEGDPKSFSDQAKVNYISSDELKKIIDQNLFLVDVRKNSEFNLEHLNGATNIPLDDLEKRSSEIPSGKKTILYDNTGIDAFKGAVRLFDLGNFNILSLSDGLNAWKKKGFEVIK
jgi:hydroxyacylglutathione hydrolase